MIAILNNNYFYHVFLLNVVGQLPNCKYRRYYGVSGLLSKDTSARRQEEEGIKPFTLGFDDCSTT